MRELKRTLVAILFALCLCVNSVFACTAIGTQYKDQYFAGKNNDWMNKNAAIVINPRGMVNNAESAIRHDWLSKYGSITVNELEKGRVISGAMAGINEEGLCVLALGQINAKYPSLPTKPIVPTELLATYFLDNAATVSEAIALAQKFDVQPSTLPDKDATQLAKTLGQDRNTVGDVNLHLFIQDEKGDAAVFDYLDEKLVIHRGDSLPILVLSNDSYGDSLEFLKRLKEFGGKEDLPGTFDSLSRFAKAAFALKVMPQSESKLGAVSNLFIALAYAQNPIVNTQWTAVFDLSSKTMYLRSIDNQQIQIVRLNKFDISEDKPSKFLSINNDLSGYVENEFTVLNKQL